MSPVSRGRKPKKNKAKKRAQRSSAPEVRSLPALKGIGGPAGPRKRPGGPAGPRKRPAWFDPAIKAVLDGAASLETAGTPRELEQLTAELLGAELHRALKVVHGMWFAWWFEEVVAAAEDTSAFLLLHGLAAIGTPELASSALAAARRVRESAGELPEWLDDLPEVTATGEVFRMRDAYGTRFAVLAGFTYGHGREPSVFLFDIDASGFVKLVGAGVFDDVEQATAAWLATVGDTAGETTPRPVANPDELMCVVHCDLGETTIIGDETRVVMDNWFRAQRRRHELGEALRRRRLPLPAYDSLYHDLATSPMVDEFTSWYTDKYAIAPDPEALPELALEWMEGGLPETWYRVSPERVGFFRVLFSDWVQEDPITLGVMALFPDWVAWLGERAGLPDHLRTRLDAAIL